MKDKEQGHVKRLAQTLKHVCRSEARCMDTIKEQKGMVLLEDRWRKNRLKFGAKVKNKEC